MPDKRNLVVLDFDHTVIDDNSDTVVRSLLRSPVPMKYKPACWIPYMQSIFTQLHKEGTTQPEITSAVTAIKPVRDFPQFLKFLEPIAEVIVISDSNRYFIEAWLEAHKVRHLISRVFTNPGEFVDGALLIDNYHTQTWCKDSTVNLCKGSILTDYLKERGVDFDHVLYIGDGRNDFCPSKTLTEKDVVFPRVGFPLYGRLGTDEGRSAVKADVVPWTTTTEIELYIQTHLLANT